MENYNYSIFTNEEVAEFLTWAETEEEKEAISYLLYHYEEEIEKVIYTVENFSTIRIGQTYPVITISDKTEQEMFRLGFSYDFITNPILVIDYITINCGAYDKMPLSLEYLYEKLKGRMSKITDV